MMNGMNRINGTLLTGVEHLRQSIRDILTTPKGTRVMRRSYGSRLFELIDAPMNQETIVEIYAATAEALDIWEPRLKLDSVKVTSIVNGTITIDLVGEYVSTGEQLNLQGLEL